MNGTASSYPAPTDPGVGLTQMSQLAALLAQLRGAAGAGLPDPLGQFSGGVPMPLRGTPPPSPSAPGPLDLGPTREQEEMANMQQAASIAATIMPLILKMMPGAGAGTSAGGGFGGGYSSGGE